MRESRLDVDILSVMDKFHYVRSAEKAKVAWDSLKRHFKKKPLSQKDILQRETIRRPKREGNENDPSHKLHKYSCGAYSKEWDSLRGILWLKMI